MELFKKVVVSFILFTIVCLSFPLRFVSADVLPENPWESSCNKDEVEVLCQNRSSNYDNPPAYWGCETFASNDKYRLLTYKKDITTHTMVAERS